jgi:hypothetical protein
MYIVIGIMTPWLGETKAPSDVLFGQLVGGKAGLTHRQPDPKFYTFLMAHFKIKVTWKSEKEGKNETT